jgi:hypothetical protein
MEASLRRSPVIFTLMFTVMGLIGGLSYRFHTHPTIPTVVWRRFSQGSKKEGHRAITHRHALIR